MTWTYRLFASKLMQNQEKYKMCLHKTLEQKSVLLEIRELYSELQNSEPYPKQIPIRFP